MNLQHFEYLAAILAELRHHGLKSDLLDCRIADFCHKFGRSFDHNKFELRVNQLTSGPIEQVWRYVK